MIPPDSKIANVWFDRVRTEFGNVTKRFAGKKIVYLEIGSWAGASAEFVAKNILTHPESVGIGIDLYAETRIVENIQDVKDCAASRVAFLGDRWKWIYEASNHGIRTAQEFLGKRRVDLAYIDGNHSGSVVLQDWCLLWPLLREGSVVIFDDYWHKRASNQLWPHVRDAVIGIELAFAGLIKLVPGLHKRQIGFAVVRKALPLMEDREAVIAALPNEQAERQKRIRKALNGLV